MTIRRGKDGKYAGRVWIVGLCLLLTTAIDCRGHGVSEDSDAGQVETDAAMDGQTPISDGGLRDSGSNGDGGDPHGLVGPTRLAFLVDNVPTVTDGEITRLVPAWTGPAFLTIEEVRLSRDGSAVAFCANDGSGGIDLFAGPIGQAVKAYDHALLCKCAAYEPSSSTVLWIEYGQGVEPHNRLRLMDLAGNPMQGDASGGSEQVWRPTFFDGDGKIVAIHSGSSDIGPLVLFDRSTQSQQTVSTQEVRSPFDLSPERKVAGGYNHSLFVIDLFTGSTTEVFSFPHSAPLCEYVWPLTQQMLDAGCFLEVSAPAWSPDGTRIAFRGMGNPAMTPDSDGDIFVLDLISGSTTRITDDDTRDFNPRMSGDGEHVYWQKVLVGIVRAPADGSSEYEVMVPSADLGVLEVAWPHAEWL